MWKKVILILVIALFVLGGLVRFGVPYYADQKIKNILEKADSASYSFLDIDVWAGNVLIKDIYLADTNGNLAEQPVFIALDNFEVSGADLWRAYRKNELVINKVSLGKGRVIIPIQPKDSSDEKSRRNNKALLSQISINRVSIDSLGFDLPLDSANENEAFSGVLHFVADSVSIPLAKNKKLNYANSKLVLSQLYAQPHKSIAYFSADSLVFSSNRNELRIHNILMRQRIDQNKYASHFGYDKDYVKLDVYRLTVKGIPKRLESLADGFHLPYIEVFGPEAYLFKDRRLPHPTNEKKFIVEALSELDIPIRIDTIDLVDGQLYFNENWRDDFVPGQLYLSDIQASLYNLNNRGPTEKGNWCIIDGEITLYQKLRLGIDWEFDLRENGKAFTLDLDIGSTPFSILNPFTENTVGAHFKQGYLHGGRMYVEGNKTNGAGSLDLYYSDLKVQFLDKQTHHTNVIQWAEGGIANLAVRNNNLPGKRAKRGVAYTEPLKDRAIFGYVMRMFFSGFKDIALGSNNEAKVAERGMQYIEMPKDAQEVQDKTELKEMKDQRKAARRARRKK